MMESPEARQLATVPWLFGRQGLGILALVTALAATFLATDVTYLAGALLLVGLGAHAWARLAFARVVYLRKPSRSRAFRGDNLILDSTLANPRLLPLPWVEVWEHLPSALQPEGEWERSFTDPERVCNRRGVYPLGHIALRTGDPFGFIERQRIFADRSEILVYPKVVPLRRL